jgi:hypothetical protein
VTGKQAREARERDDFMYNLTYAHLRLAA